MHQITDNEKGACPPNATLNFWRMATTWKLLQRHRKESKMTKHTPGPWDVQVNDLRGGRYYTVRRPGREDIDIHEEDGGAEDAPIIAVAPELLELARMVANLNPGAREVGPGMPAQIVGKARAEIAKEKSKQKVKTTIISIEATSAILTAAIIAVFCKSFNLSFTDVSWWWIGSIAIFAALINLVSSKKEE
jgi:hypothetical protein